MIYASMWLFNRLHLWIMQSAYGNFGHHTMHLHMCLCWLVDSDVQTHSAPCSLLSMATSKRHVRTVKVCFKSSLHGLAGVPVMWKELFVAASLQCQGFKSAVTSSVTSTYNCSAISDEAAVLFSHWLHMRHCSQCEWFSIVGASNMSSLKWGSTTHCLVIT